METYIAILRGINVSGQKTINMNELKDLVKSLNFDDIQTYIQSGNIIFKAQKTDKKKLSTQIEKSILDKYLFSVPVIVLNKLDLENIIASNPFINEKGLYPEKMHVTFLSDMPEMLRVNNVKEMKFETDQFVISEKVIYLYCPDGYGKTKFSNGFFESKLKVTATTRNWKTVNNLLKLING